MVLVGTDKETEFEDDLICLHCHCQMHKTPAAHQHTQSRAGQSQMYKSQVLLVVP